MLVQVVVNNIRDTVPKAIGFFLVKAVQEKMQYECHTAVSENPRSAPNRSHITGYFLSGVLVISKCLSSDHHAEA